MTTKPQHPIKLVVTDIDGTLIAPDKKLTPRTIAAAQQLKERGIHLALVSSRPARGLDMLMEPLAIQTPRAGFNGARIEWPDGRVVKDRLLGTQLAQKAAGLIAQAHIDLWIFAGSEWYLSNPNNEYIAREQRSIAMPFQMTPDLSSVYSTAYKVMGVSSDYDAISRVENTLTAHMADEASISRSQPRYVEVTVQGADKGIAVKDIAATLGVGMHETATIGDMDNDIPMFVESGFAIAMGQAPERVRAHCHAVTSSNAEEGWARAMENLIL